jgi:hypothetical protein
MKPDCRAVSFAPLIVMLLFASPVVSASAAAPTLAAPSEYRQWIVDMKAAARGPFSRLRWFCKDGRITPPKPYVCGDEGVLKPDEIKQLIRFAKELPDRFPRVTDDQGNPAPADIEFGFLDGKLKLFQIRPFLESRKARGSGYLGAMDKSLQAAMDKKVDMLEVPNE